ncbi:MAG: hypothetical protein WCT14_09210 [Treponemataceae bacterium]
MRQVLKTAFLLLGAAVVMVNLTAQPKQAPGLNYSYKYATNFFKAEATLAFMDDYLFPLKVKAKPADAKDVYISLFDLERIYAPDFKVIKDGDRFSVEHTGKTVKATVDENGIDVAGTAATLTAAPRIIDDEICVPVAAFMSAAFGKDTALNDKFVTIGYTQGKLEQVPPRRTRLLEGKLRGKKFGFIYDTYWFEEGKRTMSYRMYIPTTYDPKVPNKMILLVHGNTVNQDYWFTDTYEPIYNIKPIEDYAEKHGYILVAPNAYIVAGNYGDTDNIPYMTEPTRTALNDAEKGLRILSGKGFMMGFDEVLKKYNIDRKKIFLMGNSMGGKGTLFLGNKFHETFKALVVTGMMPNLTIMNGNPYPNIVNKPLFFVEGTEDEYGFDIAQKNSAILATYLKNYKTFWSAGGLHTTAWARSLEQIFDFLNKQK